MEKKGISYYLFHIFNNTFLALVGLSALVPFIMIISTSFNTESDINKNGYALITRKFSLEAYQTVFSAGSRVYNAYATTIFVTVVGTAIGLFVTSMLAFGLSRKNLPGRTALTFLVFFTMLFNGGLIPWYLVCKFLGMVDSIWSMIIPSVVSSFYMFIMRNFFSSIPAELEESAIIDGAGDFTIFCKVILPLSGSAIATIGLFYAVAYWNQWYNALIYLRSIEKYPLQMLLREILSRADAISSEMSSVSYSMPAESMKMAMVILTTGPILFVYPFIQKYFVKGVMIGAIKG